MPRASKSGKFIILQISNDSAFNTSRYGYATLSDGSQPNWQDYKSKYAYFKQFKKIATYLKKTIPKVMTGSTIFRAVDGLKQPVLLLRIIFLKMRSNMP